MGGAGVYLLSDLASGVTGEIHHVDAGYNVHRHESRRCTGYRAGIMPTLLISNGFKFFFYSREGQPLEPPHVHVRQGDREAKLWLIPIVRVAWSKRIDPRTLKRLTAIAEDHRAEFEEKMACILLPEPIAVRFRRRDDERRAR